MYVYFTTYASIPHAMKFGLAHYWVIILDIFVT